MLFLLALPPVTEAEEAADRDVPAAGSGAQLQEAAPDAAGEPPFIPISRLVEALHSGFPSWRPDWPFSMPADAFLVSGDWSAVSLSGPFGELTLRRNGDGSLSAFPFFYGGIFFPVDVSYDDRGILAGFTVGSGIPLRIDFLESGDPLPVLIRIMREDAVYFVLIRYTDALVMETWYDEAGGALGVYSCRYDSIAGERRPVSAVFRSDGGEIAEEYAYDSLGNITAIASPAGLFSALYTGGPCPRYWRIRAALPGPPETGTEDSAPEAPQPEGDSPAFSAAFITLQWDEDGSLVRLSGEPGTDTPEASSLDGEERFDRGYAYSRDGQGNWTERREIVLVRRFGYLVPEGEFVLRRRIEYRAGE
jgi:YD repeat-containing protein